MKWLIAPFVLGAAACLGAGAAGATAPPNTVPGADGATTTTLATTLTADTSVPETTLPLSQGESGAVVPAPPESPSAPLLQIPTGCEGPPVASVVFVGRMIAKDYRVARFQIEQVRAGTTTGYALGDLIDVRYGTDVQFLRTNDDYLVGAVPQGTDLVLTSKVREAKPVLGGNAVIGLTEKARSCPAIEDPIRTFHVDGSEIDAGMFQALSDDKRGIALAFAKPIAVVVVVVLALVLIRWLFTAIFVSIRRAADGEPIRRATRSG